MADYVNFNINAPVEYNVGSGLELDDTYLVTSEFRYNNETEFIRIRLEVYLNKAKWQEEGSSPIYRSNVTRANTTINNISKANLATFIRDKFAAKYSISTSDVVYDAAP